MSSTTFTDNEYDLAYPPGVENNYWTRARVSILTHVLKSNKLADKKILEIGCGKGIVVRALRKKKINCLGVELAAIDAIEEVADFLFSGQDATQLDESFRNSIEAILLLDVIEHIPDDIQFLTSLKHSFPNATHILITVPARKEIWSNYDEFYGHFRRYDLSMVRSIAQSAKLTFQFGAYFFHCLFLVGLVTLKLSRGKRSVRIQSPRGVMIILHRVISLFFVVEYSLCPRSFYGSSIIALYKTD